MGANPWAPTKGAAVTSGHTYLRTHDLSAEHLLIDLGEAVTEVHASSRDGQDRGAITLVKQGGLAVVISHLHAGAALEEHSAPGAATVQVLDGRVRVTIGDESLELPSGRVIAFDSRVRHRVEGIEDSTLLLTIAMPGQS